MTGAEVAAVFDKLAPSSKWAVREILATLSSDWTGELVVKVTGGGVNHIRGSCTTRPPKNDSLTPANTRT
jgi:hypothetical protein